MEQKSRLGNINPKYNTIKLKEILTRDNSGEWGDDPDKEFIYVIRGTNFNNDGILNISDIALRYLTAEQIKEKKLYENDIIIERSGGSDTQPVGRVGFIDKKIADINCSCANFIQRISLIDSVNSKYIYYCLQQLYEMKQTTAMQAQTTGLRNLDWKMYKKTILPNPELKEQNAIAGIISKVDQCIENTQKTIDATQKLKKSLMQNLLTGRMKPDGTMRKDNEFYEHPKLGKVPIGWDVKKLKDITLNRGDYGSNSSAVPFSKETPRFIRITDISDDGQLFENDAVSSTDTTEKYLLNDDDFLFARTGDTVGKSLLYKEKMGKAIFAGYLIRFVLNKELIIPEYFDLIAKSEFFESFKVSMKRVGVKPNINSREYCSFKFIIPTSKNEQLSILKYFNSIFSKKIELNEKILYLKRLRKSLMQNLLTGKKRVDVEKINNLLESMK